MAGPTPVQSGGVSGLGGLLYSNPTLGSAPIDAPTQSFINEQAGTALNNGPNGGRGGNYNGAQSNAYAQQDLSGTSPTADLTGATHFQSALGGPQDPNMQAALQARAQRTMGANLNQLQRQAQVTGFNQNNQQMQNAFGDVTGAQTAMNQASQAQVQAAQNNANSRNSIISSVFGAAGGAAGSMFGSGGPSAATQAQWAQGNAQLEAAPEGEVDLNMYNGNNTGY